MTREVRGKAFQSLEAERQCLANEFRVIVPRVGGRAVSQRVCDRLAGHLQADRKPSASARQDARIMLFRAIYPSIPASAHFVTTVWRDVQIDQEVSVS